MKKNKIFNLILNIVITLMVIYLVIFWFFLGRANISGQSMEPTFHNKDKVIFERKPKNIERFNILAIHLDKNYMAHNYKEDIIKRVVGLPGDEVKLVNGKLFINNEFVKQNFTHNFANSNKNWGKLKKEEYVVLGDNRPNSLDSRYIGTINKKDIFGRIFTKSWW